MMSKYSSGVRFSVLAGALVLAAACGGGDQNADSALALDTTLNRDLALAGTDTAAQPQLTDVPASPAATTPATRTTATKSTATKSTTTRTSAPTKTASGNTVTRSPAASGAGARVGTIASGTQLALRANSEVCTNTSKVGDRFTATLNEAVSGSNGATIPAGATVTLTVTKLEKSNNINDPIEMQFAVNSVSFGGKNYALEASVASAAVDRVRTTTRATDAKKVVAGAAIGAIAGQVLGKDTKSTVIGGAVGGAAGAAAAAATADYEGCVRSGGSIVVTLSGPLQVTV